MDIRLSKIVNHKGRQSGLVDSELDSRSRGCAFKSRLIHYTRDAMIDSCTQSCFNYYETKENIGSRIGHIKKA